MRDVIDRKPTRGMNFAMAVMILRFRVFMMSAPLRSAEAFSLITFIVVPKRNATNIICSISRFSMGVIKSLGIIPTIMSTTETLTAEPASAGCPTTGSPELNIAELNDIFGVLSGVSKLSFP